jgi:Nickel responsive protein SCO4226-like
LAPSRKRIYDPGMPRYIIVRSFDVGETEMPGVGRRSRQIVEDELPEITWEHSHVVVDVDTGKVRTFCVYSAPSEEVIREHSTRLGQHEVDSIDEIVGDVTPADFPPV